MTLQIRHFVLTGDGGIREFSADQAAQIAAGSGRIPELADARVRYLQVKLDSNGGNELKVQTSGAAIQFDAEGRLAKAGPPEEDEQFSRFEHDAVVQWTLREVPNVGPTFH
jgi:hypothetical protein